MRKCVFVAILSLWAVRANASAIVFTASATSAAGIQAPVDAYRTALGTLNPNVAGSFGTGRREINWDGVPDVFAAPNNLPANFFNVNSPRGVVFSTPGTGFQVSADSSNPPVEFGNIDASYPERFQTFSAERLFTALGSNITDVNFFIPGSGTAAVTNGFGAVFTDVDSANVTSLQFFDADTSLGTFFVPNAVSGGLSFLGVSFTEGAVVSRVRITSGNQVLGPGNSSEDLVAMDDFIYGEPVVAAAPEPGTLVLAGLAVAALARRKVHRLGSNPST